MRPLFAKLIAVPFLAESASAQINSSWTGGVEQHWHKLLNWDISLVPNNSGSNTYNAFLGGGAGLVFVNANTTIETLTTQVGEDLAISDGFDFTVRDSTDNNGNIMPGGNINASRFFISDP